jgi:hypothetical protein
LKTIPLENAARELRGRYTPPANRGLSDAFIADVAVQTVVISTIAERKFRLFDWAISAVITAFLMMTVAAPLILAIAYVLEQQARVSL